MSDITIALDAGHGGSDPGAVYNGRAEKDDIDVDMCYRFLRTN